MVILRSLGYLEEQKARVKKRGNRSCEGEKVAVSVTKCQSKKIEVWNRRKIKDWTLHLLSLLNGKPRRDLGTTMWRLQHRIPCIIMAVHDPPLL